MNNPFRLFEEARIAYQRYLDSPFRLRYNALLEERRDLLVRDRQLYRKPLFEPLPPYESSHKTIRDACKHLGVPEEFAEFLGVGLFDPTIALHRHQFEAWEQSRQGRPVVVTSGTGSGKTECYLIPVFASLLEESMRWGGAPARPASQWWWRSGRGAVPQSQRSHEPASRAPAVRALLLYPLNALIEDQLGRIRKAIDLPAARSWLDAKRGANRFWFGRYASRTPVAGVRTDAAKRAELKTRLRTMDREWNNAQASVQRGASPAILQYFQDPDGAEAWSRWDMHDAAPDVLITNYSMLNIMLMRSVEDSIFDQTRRWLAADRERNVFHLIVDELHTYRGTPGTEVAYLLRALLERLEIAPESPQLRVIATSASIESGDAASLEYLEQFFGIDRMRFSVIPGHRQLIQKNPAATRAAARAFAAFHNDLDDNNPKPAVDALAAAVGSSIGATPQVTLNAALEQVGAAGCVLAAADTGPFTDDELADTLFASSTDDARAAARGVVRALIHARTNRGIAPLPLRAHLFFHNAGRIWACASPACTGRTGTTSQGAPPPPVGKMFTEPRPRCDACGGRVLELLYCQPCGDVFLGGFKVQDGNNAWHLTPDYPNLKHVPDRAGSLARKFGEYMVFWPGGRRALYQSSNGKWGWQGGGVKFEWVPAQLDVKFGRIARVRRVPPSSDTIMGGYVFIASDDNANAFAWKCRSSSKAGPRDFGVGWPGAR